MMKHMQTSSPPGLPKAYALVEAGNWVGVMDARRQGMPWQELKTRTGFSALGRAIVDVAAPIVERLLNLGASPHPFRLNDGTVFSPLWTAMERRQDATVQHLLDAGADPNEAPPHPESSAPDLLTLAALHGSLFCTQHLLARGAQPNGHHHHWGAPLHHWLTHARQAALSLDPSESPAPSLDESLEAITGLVDAGASLTASVDAQTARERLGQLQVYLSDRLGAHHPACMRTARLLAEGDAQQLALTLPPARKPTDIPRL